MTCRRCWLIALIAFLMGMGGWAVNLINAVGEALR